MAGCSPASGFVAFFASRSSPSDVSSFLHQDEKVSLCERNEVCGAALQFAIDAGTARTGFIFSFPSSFSLYVRKTICAPRFSRLWTKARAVTKTLLSDASLPNFQAVMLLRHLMRSDNCSHQVLPGFLLVLDCDCTFSATA
ncbi:hypothetical protein TGCAST_244165 [Toxoplasma gondii CAST]|uniref:Uncharacterized protein n=1 Tax=Toxoplasma gondii CAST TaxID=943122 RepID=A0A425HSX6_TOXGO|nr:hypothetical protein TGCAST_244165 [Toxoplasma gondii CAST]